MILNDSFCVFYYELFRFHIGISVWFQVSILVERSRSWCSQAWKISLLENLHLSIWDSIHLMCRLLNLWICLSFTPSWWTWCFFQGVYRVYMCQMQSGSLPEPPRCFAGKDATEEFDMLHDRKVIKKYGIDEGTVVLKGTLKKWMWQMLLPAILVQDVLWFLHRNKKCALCVSWTFAFCCGR